MAITPKKSLGQHFLVDKNIIRKIVNSFTPRSSEFCIEIGPGQGALTSLLLDRCHHNILFIDTDKEAVQFLRTRFPEAQNQFILSDFLQYDFSNIQEEKIALIGNLPYNISSQIFFKILDSRHRIDNGVFMIQKEVAERLVAKAGNKTYGILSVLLQAFYDIELLFTVSPNVFHPKPNVQSAVIRITRNSTKKLPCDESLFFRIVKQSFGQRRKMLRKSLANLLPSDSPYATTRPEMLTINQFIDLTTHIQSATQP